MNIGKNIEIMSRSHLAALLIILALELAASQPNLTPEQKKQSFMQTLDLLGKDTKVKYNNVMAELNSKINSEPNPKIKALGEKMLSNIEGGEYYDNLGRLRQVIMEDVMNAKLNADETAKVIILAQDFMEKFQNVFGKFIS
ncbi:hypothetical protein Y032_0275g1049 [Ancylostoma ceylanicum]|uniref:Nematode fatty acid retinoid binding protein n=1 Tax=Ancylostoma ceylanicum TaxID=53326 RepID=A0A016S8R9_9BILA|nr:hypothetical protein Y032_0275g1049 [Ancylostoma ceylanicum]